ncbi:MAG: 2'-5' RNA ligase family protein [Cumulibacter sp.]
MRVPPHTDTQVLIGVTIPIPAPYAQTLSRARMDSGDVDALAIAPHITLLPPMAVERDDLDSVSAHLRQVAAGSAPFVVTLAGTGTFRPTSATVFVALSEGSREATHLHEVINAGVLRQEPRFPYHPHVTLAHNVGEEFLEAAYTTYADFDATFPVVGFTRYEQSPDGVWRDAEHFTLTSTSSDTSESDQ